MRTALIILAISFLTGLDTSGRGWKNVGENSSPLMKWSASQRVARVLNPTRVEADKIVIKDAWIQEGPPSQKITAAFMLIENHNSVEIALLSAVTDAARVIELHKMELEDGMMSMRQVDSINIPAGGMIELKPGGYHLMVIGLNKVLKEGEDVKVTLRFSNDIRKTITVPVKKRSEEGDTNQ